MKILQWEILIEKFLLETQFQIEISNHAGHEINFFGKEPSGS